MRSIFFAAFILCTVCSAYAAEIVFPKLSGHVVDEAHVIDANTKERLERALAAYERKTSNQMVVVTLPSLQGQEIEEYGYKLGRHWQLGVKQRNNGALLIVVPSERKLRIEVGYGLEPVLTDAHTRLIIERIIVPRFRNNDITGGIILGVEAMMKAASGEFKGLPEQSASSEDTVASGGWLIFLILLFWIISRGKRGRRSSALSLLPLILGSGFGSGGSRGGNNSWGGGGGSFGGGGASGRW